MSPEATDRLRKAGFTVNVESGAGAFADFNDAAFEKAGATIVTND
jgi:NAD(P) transhydrogenase subunit alpha